MTCAGAVGVMSKLGRLPVIARLGLLCGVITTADIEASAAMVIDPATLQLTHED
jgi:CBS domain-containing protein